MKKTRFWAATKNTETVPYLGVVHRLDQPVSGILVFARTPAAAKNLNQQLQNDQFEKYYQAVVCGSLPDSGTLTDYLVKDGRTNTSRIPVPKKLSFRMKYWKLPK